MLYTCMLLQAVATMVEECCKYVNQTPDLETKLKLIDTLIIVSKGKVGGVCNVCLGTGLHAIHTVFVNCSLVIEDNYEQSVMLQDI